MDVFETEKKGLNLRGFDRNICRFQKNPLFSILRLLSSHPLGISDLLNCDKTPSFRKLILWALQRFESNPVHRSKGGEQAVINQITFFYQFCPGGRSGQVIAYRKGTQIFLKRAHI